MSIPIVGECGQVISFEVRDKHLSVAKKNVSTWVESQRYHGNQEWFDNVDFHLGDIKNAVDVIDKPVDAVSLFIYICSHLAISYCNNPTRESFLNFETATQDNIRPHQIKLLTHYINTTI